MNESTLATTKHISTRNGNNGNRPSSVEQQRPTLLSSLYSGLFILTWALVGIAAFRNTLTW